MTWGQKLREEGFEQGLEQGREQGREQGLEQGLERGFTRGRLEERRALVLRLTERRFPGLTEAQRQQILDADEATLQGLLDRLLEAPSIEALLG